MRHPPPDFERMELRVKVRRQEEMIERLRRILHRYGDRVPMATCHRADWQQEIDDAMEWVANNPEERTDGA